MEESDIKRLAETVEAGLRDGRSLDSLRNAMKESGYPEGDIRKVISSVDRKKTVRRPQRRRDRGGWIAASVIIIVLLAVASYLFTAQHLEQAGPGQADKGDGDLVENGMKSVKKEGIRTCYVVNESIKQVMIDAGAQCDKWYLIKEI